MTDEGLTFEMSAALYFKALLHQAAIFLAICLATPLQDKLLKN